MSELLDAVAQCGLSPVDTIRTDVLGKKITADPEGELVASVVRTRIDPFVQKLSFLRVLSGTLTRDQTIACSTARKEASKFDVAVSVVNSWLWLPAAIICLIVLNVTTAFSGCSFTI